MSAICSVHGKSRTFANLQDDGMGGMCCTPNSQCQTGGGGGQKRGANNDWSQMMQMMGMMPMGGGKRQRTGASGGVMCSVHGKSRSAQSMQEDGSGGYCCKPGSDCQMGGGGAPGIVVICSVHGKNRSEQSCVPDGSGGFQCAPGMQCQIGKAEDGEGATTLVTCSAHQKQRSLQSCQDDCRGGFRCAPGFECKTSGGVSLGGGGGPSKGGPSKARGKGSGDQGPMAMVPASMLTQLMAAVNGGGFQGAGAGCKGNLKGKGRDPRRAAVESYMDSMGWW